MELLVYRVVVLAIIFVATSLAHDVKPTAMYVHRFAVPVEEMEWNTVKDTGDVQRLESFQSRYPNGHYSRQVSRLLLKLRPAPVVADGPETQLVPVGPTGLVVKVAPSPVR